MIKNFFVTLLTLSIFFVSCNKNDDDVNQETNIPIEERYALDNEAVEQYLNDFYFNPKNGRLTKFDDVVGNEDDSYPSLKSIAKVDELGIWYAENPYHKGTGETIVSNDETSIYLSYYAQYFVATNNSTKKYGTINSFQSSINSGDGSALKDPTFYYFTPTAQQIKDGVKREYVELKNFSEGLKHFKTTDRAVTDLYNFQGVIILPSKLAFSRETYYTGSTFTQYSAYRDATFIFNFELPKTEKRTN